MTPDEMRQLGESWERSLRGRGLSTNSVRAYGDSVRALAAWEEETGQHGLGRHTVAAFLGDLLDAPPQAGRRGDHSATANLRARAIRQFSAWLADEDEIGRDDLRDLKAPKPGETVVAPLTEEQLKALIAVCEADKSIYGKRDAALVRLASVTTQRADELLRMDLPRDVDFRRGLAVVRGKGNRERVVPFGDKEAASIDRYLRARRKAGIADEGPLWISQRKKRLSYGGLYSSLGKRAALAGIADMHPHRLRHTAATRWLAKGGSEGGLMAVAGWRRREMLDRYVAHTRAEMAAEEARKLNLGDL